LHFWQQVVEGPVAEHSFAGRDEAAEAVLREELEAWRSHADAPNSDSAGPERDAERSPELGAGRDPELDAGRNPGRDSGRGPRRGPRRGEAWLVGAGPGNPDLITLRGRQLLAAADVVLYDRLGAPLLLRFARRDAQMISVGKTPNEPSVTQAQINELLVKLVAEGKRVCRLKGGDPMVFGRGGEEVEALVQA